MKTWIYAAVGLSILAAKAEAEVGVLGSKLPVVAVVSTTRTQTGADGKQSSTQSQYSLMRDAKGRVMTEGGGRKVIRDPTQSEMVVLDMQAKTATRFSMNTPGVKSTAVGSSQAVLNNPPRKLPEPGTLENVTVTSLGESMIAGVKCKGVRKVGTVPARLSNSVAPVEFYYESWESVQYAMPMRVVARSKLTGDVVTTVKITGTNPSNDAFEVPSDFRSITR